MNDAFFHRDGEFWVPSEMTRGPWNNEHQHGGPPAALLGGAMARFGDDADDFAMAKVTTELVKPVPLRPLCLVVEMERGGRTAQRLKAELRCDRQVVAFARGLRLRKHEVQGASLPIDAWPMPEELEEFEFPFFRHETAYHRAVELKVAHGQWGSTPVGFWARTRIPLVAGVEDLPLERVLAIADAQSGMGIPLDVRKFTFVNPEMTLYLDRMPSSEWLGFDIRSSAGPHGVGLAQSALRDLHQEIGRSAQSLVVRPR